MTYILRVLTCTILFPAFFFMSAAAQSQSLQRAGDSSVYMIAPDGYERKTTGGADFFNMENRSSITVLEMPIEAYDRLVLQHTDKKVAQSKVDDRRCETDVFEVMINQERTPYMQMDCKFSPRNYTEYLVLMKGKNAIQIRFTSYDGLPSKDEVLQSAQSIILKSDDVNKYSYFDDLDFTFALKDPFVHMTAVYDMAALTTTLTPGDFKKSPAIGISIRESLPVEAEYEAEESPIIDAAFDLLFENGELTGDNYDTRGVKYLQEDFVNIGGKQGYYIKATRKGKLVIQYVWPHTGNQYFKVQAIGTRKTLKPYEDVIAEIVQSVSAK